MKTPKVGTLIVDSGGFIKHVKLEEIGERMTTLNEVVAEIRDAATRQRLAVLPYELNYRAPQPESLRFVTEFSKKTGDFGVLSAVDLRVVALAYEVWRELSGAAEPGAPKSSTTTTISGASKAAKPATAVVGFHQPVLKAKPELEEAVEAISLEEEAPTSEETPSDTPLSPPPTVAAPVSGDDSAPGSEGSSDEEEDSGDEGDEDEDDDEEYEEEEEEEEGDGGWITQGNLSAAIRDMGGDPSATVEPDVFLPAACLTTDFAMQNVLLHLGVPLVSISGLRIRRLNTYILRCHACFATTSAMEKRFCPACGNATLKRVAVSVDPESGERRIHVSTRRPINTRGLRYPLPRPKGGKHALNPILVEDQPVPDNRLGRKAAAAAGVSDPSDSPFALNDVTSRGAALGLRNFGGKAGQRNPEHSKTGKKRGGKRR